MKLRSGRYKTRNGERVEIRGTDFLYREISPGQYRWYYDDGSAIPFERDNPRDCIERLEDQDA